MEPGRGLRQMLVRDLDLSLDHKRSLTILELRRAGAHPYESESESGVSGPKGIDTGGSGGRSTMDVTSTSWARCQTATNLNECISSFFLKISFKVSILL